jgi:hypothetical protein
VIQFVPKELHGGQFLWGAHHPHCARHDHHLIWLNGHPLCLGCTALYSGVFLGLVGFWWISPASMPLVMWIVGHLVFLLPTAIQPFLQNKTFKIISRTMLGACVASYFLTGIYIVPPFYPWVFRLIQVTVFLLVYRTLFRWRARKIDNPCMKCPLGHYPVCEWNLPRLMEDSEQRAVFQQISTPACPQKVQLRS